MKKTAIILIILALGLVGYWVASGSHIFTQTQVLVKGETDDLFGTTTEEWKDEFHIGLEYVGPITAALLLGAGLLFWRDKKNKNRTT